MSLAFGWEDPAMGAGRTRLELHMQAAQLYAWVMRPVEFVRRILRISHEGPAFNPALFF